MRLIENYALQLGQKINKIHTYEKYYPLPFDDYVLIQPFSKAAKNYEYISEVIDLIYPFLEKLGLKLVQVGGTNEKPLQKCYHTQGNTDFNQLEYLVSKAKMVISTDSLSAHLAGHYNKPLVVLISNNFKECVSPYFGDKSKQIILEPDRTKRNPSFSLDEGPNKQLHELKPEQIASSILKLLNIEHSFEFKTLEFGPLYNTKIMEMTPTQVVNPGQFGAEKMIVRMDFFYNEAILIEQLKVCPCIIFTNKEINREILKAFTNQRIHQIIYILGENNSNPDFIKFCQSLGININIISYLSDESINKFKLDYCELGIIHKKHILNPKDNDKYKNLNLDNLYFKSGKTILHDNKFYASFAHILNNVSMANLEQSPQKVIDSLTFWKDWEHFYFLTKTQDIIPI